MRLAFLGDAPVTVRVKKDKRFVETSILSLCRVPMPLECHFLVVTTDGELYQYVAYCASFPGNKMDLEPFRPIRKADDAAPINPPCDVPGKYLAVPCWPRCSSSVLLLQVSEKGLFLELYELHIESRKFHFVYELQIELKSSATWPDWKVQSSLCVLESHTVLVAIEASKVSSFGFLLLSTQNVLLLVTF